MVACRDAGCQLLAARALRKQVKQLGRQLDGIRRATDVEYVHRARVATRRLRAALELFGDCYEEATVARWDKAIRRLIKGLGRARDADRQSDHHAMRIAVKRLRYTMEISKAAYGSRLDGPIGVTKELQTLLGDLHDCDVWVAYLDRFLAKERKRIVRLYGHDGPLARLEAGIGHLAVRRGEMRDGLFLRLRAYWAELGAQGFWEGFREVVAGPAGHAAPSGRGNGQAGDRSLPGPCLAAEPGSPPVPTEVAAGSPRSTGPPQQAEG